MSLKLVNFIGGVRNARHRAERCAQARAGSGRQRPGRRRPGIFCAGKCCAGACQGVRRVGAGLQSLWPGLLRRRGSCRGRRRAVAESAMPACLPLCAAYANAGRSWCSGGGLVHGAVRVGLLHSDVAAALQHPASAADSGRKRSRAAWDTGMRPVVWPLAMRQMVRQGPRSVAYPPQDTCGRVGGDRRTEARGCHGRSTGDLTFRGRAWTHVSHDMIVARWPQGKVHGMSLQGTHTSLAALKPRGEIRAACHQPALKSAPNAGSASAASAAAQQMNANVAIALSLTDWTALAARCAHATPHTPHAVSGGMTPEAQALVRAFSTSAVARSSIAVARGEKVRRRRHMCGKSSGGHGRTYTHAHTYAHMHTQTRTHAHMHTHTHTHTHIHTHTHTAYDGTCQGHAEGFL